MNATTRTMITGSEGNEDYMVIARSNGYVLGIKALLKIGPDFSQYGFRMRMQKADLKPGENIESLPQAEKDKMVKTFAKIPWGKRSLVRFSTVLTVGSSYGYDFRQQLLEEASDKMGEMIGEVGEHIDPVKFLDKEDAVTFLNEKFAEIVKKIEEMVTNKQAHEGDAEIVQFGGQDEGQDIE